MDANRALQITLEVEGMLADQEAASLIASASKAAHNIVEIGSWRGRSTIALALGSLMGDGVPVWAIDPHEPYYAAGKNGAYQFEPVDRFYFMQNLVRAGEDVCSVVKPVSLPGHEAAARWWRRVDVIFFDGSHTFNHVLRDFHCWQRHVIRGGLLLFHDANEPDVAMAMRQIPERYFERVEQVNTMQILRKVW